MYKVLKLNKIHEKAENILSKNYSISDTEINPEGIIVRSFKMLDFAPSEGLLAVARAGAGVNNIPVDKFKGMGIVVMNTPGANANAVKELVICSLFLGSRDIVKGINWATSLKGKGKDVPALVEKGKEAFAGTEIMGKTLGIIGLGAIGSLVANTALNLKMDVIGYDPYLTVDNAWLLNSDVKKAKSLDTIYSKCDYITIHSPLTDDTREMLNSKTFSKMKDGVCLINCARNELVNNTDLIEALASGKISRYITDFPSDELLNIEHVIAIPHLGASTAEAETNCAIMAADQLKEYLENGNIINSVNYPSLNLVRSGDNRITLNMTAQSAALSKAPDVLKAAGLNVCGMMSAAKADAAYMIIDVCGKPNDKVISELKAITGVLKVRNI